MGRAPLPLVVLACFFISSCARPRAPPCASASDCSLNGLCVSGACICDAAWHGVQCEQLSLQPAAAIDPAYPPASWKGNTTSWGGSVVRDEDTGKFHMFLAEMLNGCRMNTWCGPSHLAVCVSVCVCAAPRISRSVAITAMLCNQRRCLQTDDAARAAH
jgi:hypothetical protein